jgi:hypothetical protein
LSKQHSRDSSGGRGRRSSSATDSLFL